MYSICGQRLHNAHITVRSRKTHMREERLSTHWTTRNINTHLLYNSLPSRLPTELLVMFYDPVFTVGERNKEKIIKMEINSKHVQCSHGCLDN